MSSDNDFQWRIEMFREIKRISNIVIDVENPDLYRLTTDSLPAEKG